MEDDDAREELAQQYYGKSYSELCPDRKRAVDIFVMSVQNDSCQ